MNFSWQNFGRTKLFGEKNFSADKGHNNHTEQREENQICIPFLLPKIFEYVDHSGSMTTCRPVENFSKNNFLLKTILNTNSQKKNMFPEIWKLFALMTWPWLDTFWLNIFPSKINLNGSICEVLLYYWLQCKEGSTLICFHHMFSLQLTM